MHAVTNKEGNIPAITITDPTNDPNIKPTPLAISKLVIVLSIWSGFSLIKIAGTVVIEQAAPIPVKTLEKMLNISALSWVNNSTKSIKINPNDTNTNPKDKKNFLPIIFIYFPSNKDVGIPIIGAILTINPINHIGIPFEAAIAG